MTIRDSAGSISSYDIFEPEHEPRRLMTGLFTAHIFRNTPECATIIQRLTRAIMAMFNNELNKGAQLIATVHDVSLLDCQTLFRKEQIWFTHKDKDGVYLYSLSEFTAEKDGIRDTTDLISKYRKGVFGALPEPDLFKSLQEVKNNA